MTRAQYRQANPDVLVGHMEALRRKGDELIVIRNEMWSCPNFPKRYAEWKSRMGLCHSQAHDPYDNEDYLCIRPRKHEGSCFPEFVLEGRLIVGRTDAHSVKPFHTIDMFLR